jgi:hypothetical protein
VLGAGLLLACPGAGRGSCRVIRYAFQIAPRVRGDGVPDFLPQVAIWLARAPDAGFVDTIMVTNATAQFGIGNRPGRQDFPSGPRFPYGRRPMALPVWAHARGQLYPMVVMNDGDEDNLGGHEITSSPEPYFCRPMMPSELVDTITCASGFFRSAKGVIDGARTSYYPPRNDLEDVVAQPCRLLVNRPGGGCDFGAAAQYALLNDLDAVATATPPAGQRLEGVWREPDGLPPGRYQVMVEVGKEFDTNDRYDASAWASTKYVTGYGIFGNLGQPSAVFSVPLTLGGDGTQAATTTDSVGHGDATGATGTLFPPDGTLAREPGSGVARLSVIDGHAGRGVLDVVETSCGVDACTPGRPPPTPAPIAVAPADVAPTSALVRLRQSSDGTTPLLAYELRFAALSPEQPISEAMFSRWTPGPSPAVGAPEAETSVQLTGLVPDSWYVVGARARGACADSVISYARFRTTLVKFQQLSGCFVLSAAFAAPEVAAMRRLRDNLTSLASVSAAAVDLYYRSAPPLARVERQSELARALARTVLRPIIDVTGALLDQATDVAGRRASEATGEHERTGSGEQ